MRVIKASYLIVAFPLVFSLLAWEGSKFKLKLKKVIHYFHIFLLLGNQKKQFLKFPFCDNYNYRWIVTLYTREEMRVWSLKGLSSLLDIKPLKYESLRKAWL